MALLGINSGRVRGLEELQSRRTASLQNQQTELEIQAFQEAQENKKRTGQLLSKAMAGAQRDNLSTDYEEGLASQGDAAVKAGMDVLKFDTAAGLDLIKQGRETKSQAHQVYLENIERKKVTNELAVQALTDVSDQESLDLALDTLSQMGVMVPERVRKWGVETKGWIERKSLSSDAYVKRLDIEQKAAYTKMLSEKSEAAEKEAKLKQQEAARKEALARDKMTAARKPVSVSKDAIKADEVEINLLDKSSEAFEDLSDDAKQVVAKDIRAKAVDLMRTNSELDQVEATQLARQEILSKIRVEKGFFNNQSVYDILGSASETTPAKTKQTTGPVEGKIYTDKNGVKARYVNGKYEVI